MCKWIDEKTDEPTKRVSNQSAGSPLQCYGLFRKNKNFWPDLQSFNEHNNEITSYLPRFDCIHNRHTVRLL
jgi:hypothetical protein